MKKTLVRLLLALKTVRELGPGQSYQYAVYQAGLRSGFYRQATPTGKYLPLSQTIHAPFNLPGRGTLEGMLGEQATAVIDEAEEAAAGKARLFGRPAVPMILAPQDTQQHWTRYEGRPNTWGVEDIKFLWEPARFGWVYPLGRAYLLTGSERYPTAFWEHFETFLKANPPNRGPNWASAQEVALRLMALLFASCAFQQSPESSPKRMASLAGAVAAHAQRIPPTLSYARAQNNNHRVSEALGMYAAGQALPEHAQAQRWREMGWKELNRALQSQIELDGTYAQHSMNYHRLMLHAALLALLFGQPFPKATKQRLVAATNWLLAQVDPVSGRAPNLGSNDGANILPLAEGSYADYRPVAQAAARAFLGHPAFPAGPWDELGLWLGQRFLAPLDRAAGSPVKEGIHGMPESAAVHRLQDTGSWATLRAVRFQGRPSHADQLHVDLWWRGENVAMDAGTFRYTAPRPWNNTLAETFVHNTVEINRQNQMQRAGRFLWLDWAQGELLDTSTLPSKTIAAQHDGYLHLGVIHRRILKNAGPGRWQVIDYMLRGQPRRGVPVDPFYSYRLHWLLPDWSWSLEANTLLLARPDGGRLRLSITPELPDNPKARIVSYSLVRAGQALAGPKRVPPVLGWFSPTYALNVPALSFSVLVRSTLPLNFVSEWVLEDPD